MTYVDRMFPILPLPFVDCFPYKHDVTLSQITARHFCAGIVHDRDGYVTEAAPILRYMRGWTRKAVRQYVEKKGWKLREL